MKPNNLLVDANGVLKIGDFGLAKFYGSPNRIYTHQVVTRLACWITFTVTSIFKFIRTPRQIKVDAASNDHAMDQIYN